jgi:hypothetical protein
MHRLQRISILSTSVAKAVRRTLYKEIIKTSSLFSLRGSGHVDGAFIADAAGIAVWASSSNLAVCLLVTHAQNSL